MTATKLGEVTKVDVGRGVASVRLDNDGSTATLPSAVFFSGRPARLPEAGDRVTLQVRPSDCGDVVLAARLVAE